MDMETMLNVLAAKTKHPVSKPEFDDFAKTVTIDYENIAFYDAVIAYAQKYEYWYAKVFPGKQFDSLLLIGAPGSKDKSRTTKPTQSAVSSEQPIKSSVKNASTPAGAKVGADPSNAKDHMYLVMPEQNHDILPADLASPDALEAYAKATCQFLLKTFVAQGSEQELNINGSTRSQLIRLLATRCEPILFKPVLDEVIVNIYTNTFPRFKKQQMLINIGEKELMLRKVYVVICFCALIAATVYFHVINPNAPWLYRLLYMPFCYLLPMTYQQVSQKFCVINGIVGREQMKNMVSLRTKDACVRVSAKAFAIKIFIKSGLISIPIFLILLAVPPYTFK